ncbi:hypothetical protein BG000_009339 [Podila horticola]|nr:hypothetical protein BG000_009339 [Podila horticola]
MAPAPAEMDNGQPPPDNNTQLSPTDNRNGHGDPPQVRDLNDVLRQQIGHTSLRRRTQLLDAMETIVQAYSVGRDDDISFIVEQYIAIRELNIKLQRRIDEFEKERKSTGASASSPNVAVSTLTDDDEATSSTAIVSPSALPNASTTGTSTHSGASIDKSEMLVQHLRSELFKAKTQITSATIDLKSLQAEKFLLAARLDSAEKANSALQSQHVEERSNLMERASTLQQELIHMKHTTERQLGNASKMQSHDSHDPYQPYFYIVFGRHCIAHFYTCFWTVLHYIPDFARKHSSSATRCRPTTNIFQDTDTSGTAATTATTPATTTTTTATTASSESAVPSFEPSSACANSGRSSTGGTGSSAFITTTAPASTATPSAADDTGESNSGSATRYSATAINSTT